jgi:hypothetical protein
VLIQSRSIRRIAFAPLLAGSLLALAVFIVPDAAARAATACLGRPHLAASQGGHWYYRLERGTKRKCWFLAQGRGSVYAYAAPRVAAPAVRTPAQPVPTRSRSATTNDEGAKESMRDKVRRLVFGGTEPDAAAPAPVESPPSPAPAERPNNIDNARPAISAVAATPAAVADEVQESSANDAPAQELPTRVMRTITVSRTATVANPPMIAPAHLLLFVIAASAIVGSVLYTTVRLMLVRRRRAHMKGRLRYRFG